MNSLSKRQTWYRRHAVAPALVLSIWGASCTGGVEPGAPTSDIPSDPAEWGESTLPLAAASCTNADVCTAPAEARTHCFTASTDTSTRREVAQSFNPTRSGKVNFVRVNVKKLYNEAAGSGAVVRFELRALEAAKVPVDPAKTIASGSVALTSLNIDDAEITVPLTPAVVLTRNADGTPSYVFVIRVESGVGAVGVACASAGDVYAAGTAWRRDRLRISGTSFTNPVFTDVGRDLSFAFALGCDAPLADCDGLGANGCETNLNTSSGNCGSCGGACSTANVAPLCSTGSCEGGSCTAPFADCDGNKRANGCETDTSTSAANCGGCSQACSTSNINAACSGSACTGACLAGYADCNANKRSDGCETSIFDNVLNCGACNRACSTTNVTRSCTAGSCQSGTCATDFGDCNFDKQVDGCETNLNTSLTHCGGCFSTCPNVPFAQTLSCATKVCTIQSCLAGYYNLDGTYGTGCECQDTGGGASCAAAADLGSFGTGSSGTREGNVPLNTMSDWYVVAFPTSGQTIYQQKYQGLPTVALESNPNDAYRLEFYFNSCAAAQYTGGATAPFTSFSFTDGYTYGGGNIAGGPANPCSGAQCAATVVATACAFTSGAACAHGSSSYCATLNANTCGCNYQSFTNVPAPTAGFGAAAQAGCPFVNNGNSGVGTYGRRSTEWPSQLYIRVVRKAGSTSGCETYRLRISR